jgi:hypothetical protein
LDAQELAVQVQHEVVTLICPKREKYAVPAPNKFGNDGRLGPETNIDGMSAWIRRRQRYVGNRSHLSRIADEM